VELMVQCGSVNRDGLRVQLSRMAGWRAAEYPEGAVNSEAQLD
jgi:hypothetical protein